MFKDILTFLRLDYGCFAHKRSACFKWTCGLFGNDYRVASIKFNLHVIGIIMQSLKSIWQF